MHNELTERHSHLPLAYIFPKMLSGSVQILSHFTCVTESVLAHSYFTENLEEHDCHKWSWRGCESDSQTESATAIPSDRNPQERARASYHHCQNQHSSQSLVMVSKPEKDCRGTTAPRRLSDSRHHRWWGRNSWGEKLSRHSGKCSWRHTEGTTSVKLEDI